MSLVCLQIGSQPTVFLRYPKPSVWDTSSVDICCLATLLGPLHHHTYEVYQTHLPKLCGINVSHFETTLVVSLMSYLHCGLIWSWIKPKRQVLILENNFLHPIQHQGKCFMRHLKRKKLQKFPKATLENRPCSTKASTQLQHPTVQACCNPLPRDNPMTNRFSKKRTLHSPATVWLFNSHEWLTFNFSLSHPYNFQQTGNENSQTYQVEVVILI